MTNDRGQNDAVALCNVRLSYGPVRVLEDVSMTVPRGEICVLAGGNGIGKTSVIRLLSGAAEPDSGKVTIFGRPPGQAKIGLVWQDTYASLYPWLSALENAALPLRLRGMKRKERRRRILDMCRDLGFDLPLERCPYELSGGEQQKTCLLRALASECELLLLDEPWNNVDFDSSLDLMLHIQEVNARTALTTIIVSHSPEFSTFVAHAVIPMRTRPVLLTETDRISIECPHSNPRPREWLFDAQFREQVEALKVSLGGQQ
jgi:NitT/TauT family transport system ATP-binding protein